MDTGLKGRVALVFAASKGLGKATARSLGQGNQYHLNYG